MAFSTDQPLTKRADSVSGFKPTSRAHLAKVCDLPKRAKIVLFDLLLFCASIVAHRQLSREYGPSLSLRSTVCRRLGLGPMSARKAAKSFQRGSRVIPRPPYMAYAFARTLKQRFRIPHQMSCSGVFVRLWVIVAARLNALLAQVQWLLLYLSKLPVKATTVAPQMQRHSHCRRAFCSSLWATTVKDPKCFPVKFFMPEHYLFAKTTAMKTA